MKVLALDFGRARTGVAVSDPTGTVARPLCVVERAATEDGLARLDVPVVTFDERFTTDLAERTASQSEEDARAAAHLLSGYLTWSSGARA